MCGLVCPSRTSELEGKGYCVKGGWREEGERVCEGACEEECEPNPKFQLPGVLASTSAIASADARYRQTINHDACIQ